MTLTLPMAPTGTGEALSPAQITELKHEVRALALKRNAVILAHNYQVPEVQDVADYVGDSLASLAGRPPQRATRSSSAGSTSWPRRPRSCARRRPS